MDAKEIYRSDSEIGDLIIIKPDAALLGLSNLSQNAPGLGNGTIFWLEVS